MIEREGERGKEKEIMRGGERKKQRKKEKIIKDSTTRLKAL